MMAKNTLLLQRKKIDQLDKKIARLCFKRVQISKKLITQKAKQKAPIIDLKREREILALYEHRLKRTTYKKRITEFVIALIKLNSKYPS